MSDEKKRVCKVCEKDPESLKSHGRRCDGCKCVTCAHVATRNGDDDRCPLCTLRARKAEKAKAGAGGKPAPAPAPAKKPDDGKAAE